jgi:redox-sensitive bicupin YhaK (pirin superfamily)
MDVDQHPHIGLSTLTYLFEGEMMHQDSIGSEKRITPGSVNWMTAGNGIVHTERTPKDLRNGQVHLVHGYQMWIALPKELEDTAPSFHHIPSKEIPSWSTQSFQFSLVAGEGYGKSSPVPVHSPLFLIDLVASKTAKLKIAGELKGEIGISVIKGEVTLDGETLSKGSLLISKTEDLCELEVSEGAHLLVFGGEVLPEPRFIDWNFVSSSKDKVKEARVRWRNKEFDMISGDDSYVPLPKIG